MNYPFVKCEHPRLIRNPYTGDLLTTSCGVCKACSLNRSRKMSFLCSLEEQCHDFCYFVTLTYAQEYIPHAKFVYNEDLHCYDLFNVTDRHFDCGSFLDHVPSTLSGRAYSRNYLYYLSRKTLSPKMCIPIPSMVDLQQFVKRFRYYAQKISSEKVRYYAVSEYGPKSFRPHYHILFYFSDPTLSENFGEIISKTWKFGTIDWSLSRGQVDSYVAGYVNSRCSLPSLYACSSLRPFSCHSVRFAHRVLPDAYETPYESSPEELVRLGSVVHGDFVDYTPWRSVVSSYFPKCKGYNDKSHGERLVAYTVLSRAKTTYGEDKSISELSQSIYSDLYDSIMSKGDNISDFLKFFIDTVKIDVRHYCSFTEKPDFPFLDDCSYPVRIKDGDSLIYCKNKESAAFVIQHSSCKDIVLYRLCSLDKIKSYLYFSSHFLDFCCDSGRYSPDYVLRKIEDYHDYVASLRLSDFYYTQSEFVNYHPFNQIINFYDNLNIEAPSPTAFRFLESFTVPPSESDLLVNTDIYKKYIAFEELNFYNSLKHKIQNDLNNIWLI